VLKDVRHVPDMCLNLISAGKLDDAGLVNHFGRGIWKPTKGSLIVARGKKEGSLYFMLPTITQIWSYDIEDSYT